jgi:hypothetical protein
MTTHRAEAAVTTAPVPSGNLERMTHTTRPKSGLTVIPGLVVVYDVQMRKQWSYFESEFGPGPVRA